MPIDPKATKQTRARYNRFSHFYDLMETPIEYYAFSSWREKVFEHVIGTEILEVGVGTGKNLPYYLPDWHVIGIDISEGMLSYAKKRTEKFQYHVDLRLMDAQQLMFPDNSFDTVLGTFVFCSVPDPGQGLKELRRVCKPEGRLILLEHMRPGSPVSGKMFDLLNPLVVRLTGANINRYTLENLEKAEFQITQQENLFSDIVKFIVASPAK